jgi:predicted transcriptional regulator
MNNILPKTFGELTDHEKEDKEAVLDHLSFWATRGVDALAVRQIAHSIDMPISRVQRMIQILIDAGLVIEVEQPPKRIPRKHADYRALTKTELRARSSFNARVLPFSNRVRL